MKIVVQNKEEEEKTIATAMALFNPRIQRNQEDLRRGGVGEVIRFFSSSKTFRNGSFEKDLYICIVILLFLEESTNRRKEAVEGKGS